MTQKIKKICFDIDGVICTLSNDNIYSKSKPIKKNIKLINQLYKKNYEIILFTSRFMGRNKENSKKAYKMGYEFTEKQLKKWSVKYHKLIMGKPSFDVVVDDKSLFFKKNWAKILLNKLG
tara:strand:- start:560 stop:919 length:360 start_codon:yes stop_codon:yes gene_type:complete